MHIFDVKFDASILIKPSPNCWIPQSLFSTTITKIGEKRIRESHAAPRKVLSNKIEN